MSVAADFDEAFERMHAVSLAAARRLVSRDDAEEIVAEALTRAFVHWRRIGGKEWCDAWVVRVTANLALSSLRRRRSRPALEGRRVALVDDVVVDQMWLVQALGRLSRRQRQIVVLRYVADVSEVDVAASLRLRPVTVRTHAQRGLAALRQSLTDDPDHGDPAHG